jgi:hypothetical protein
VPGAAPRRERTSTPVGSPRAARSALDYLTLTVLITIGGVALSWVVSRPKFALALPSGTADRIDQVTLVAAVCTVALVAIGLVSLLAWAIRAHRHRGEADG